MKRVIRTLTAAAAALTVTAIAAPAAAQDDMTADQIIDKMLDGNNSLGVDSGSASVSLLIEDASGAKRVRKMSVRGKDFEKGGRSVMKLTAPKEVKGQAFLFAENSTGEDDVWMYLPAFGVTRRIEGSQKKGSFMGTHFTFADLESRDIESGTHARLPDETIAKVPVYVIESTPKNPADSDYGKLVVYVRKSDFVMLKMRFYGQDKKTELKTLFAQKFDKTEKGETYTKQMTLVSKKGGFTTIVIDSVDGSTEIPDAVFSKDQLGK